MHLELAIPALIPAHEDLQAAFDRLRPPTLELLVARGRIEHRARTGFETWLAQSFGLETATLPAGALSALADGADARTAARCLRADPVHLHLVREHARLLPGAALSVTREEAESLCASLNAHFADVLSVAPSAGRAECWIARFEDRAPLGDAPPLAAAGDDVDPRAQADSADAKRSHVLLNELQMLLHDHPVNAAREARGEPTINSVWFWGEGPLPARAEGRWRSVTGDDPAIEGLARLCGAQARALTASADSWLASPPPEGRHLIVIDALRLPHALRDAEDYLAGVQALEVRWLAPLLEALRTQRLGMLTLHVPDASEALSVETVRADLRRFWRRPRALAPWKE